ncbi:T9SS type A sorting domain-containing protein [Candidatus Acetothermia bacterium]|nr:T9SS type A sorting domain-containing protein [Candidatus Acetothermia bacterium]
MRGLKSLTFVLALVGIALGVALMPAVSAKADGTSISLIQDIRDEIAILEADWVHVDEILIDIDEEINQVRIKILHAMQTIDAGNSLLGTVVKQDIQAAIQEKEVIITVKFEELSDFLGFIDEGIGEIIGKVEAAMEEKKLNAAKEMKVKALLLSQEKLVEFITSDANTMVALLEDGDEGEDQDNPETFDDVDDWLEFCLENQISDDFNDFQQCKESLGRALNILDDFISIKATVFKKKKLAVKKLINVKKLMLNSGPPRVRVVSTLGTNTAVQVYTLSGQLVLTDRVSGGLQSVKNKLANGIYVVVIGNRVERLVVLN